MDVAASHVPCIRAQNPCRVTHPTSTTRKSTDTRTLPPHMFRASVPRIRVVLLAPPARHGSPRIHGRCRLTCSVYPCPESVSCYSPHQHDTAVHGYMDVAASPFPCIRAQILCRATCLTSTTRKLTDTRTLPPHPYPCLRAQNLCRATRPTSTTQKSTDTRTLPPHMFRASVPRICVVLLAPPARHRSPRIHGRCRLTCSVYPCPESVSCYPHAPDVGEEGFRSCLIPHKLAVPTHPLPPPVPPPRRSAGPRR
jgi:hypothetical protein